MRLFYFLIITCLSIRLLASLDGSDPFVNDPSIIGQYKETVSYSKARNATRMIKGKTKSFCFWYNPDEWEIIDWKQNLVEEISFLSLVDTNLYAKIIVENTRIPKKEVKNLLMEKISESFKEVKLLLFEKRKVNGQAVYCFQWSGIYDGDKEELQKGNLYYFYIYIVPTDVGLIQLITFCKGTCFDYNQNTMLSFLNGITNCR